MKRLILLLVLCLIPVVGHAQLNIKGEPVNIETLSTARFGGITLHRRGETYYLGISSSNKYDDPQIFYLGESKESAVQTLKDMMELLGSMEKGTRVQVDNKGKTVSLYRISGQSLGIEFGAGAGQYWIAKSEALKFLSELE